MKIKLIPNDVCPLNAIAEMGDEAKNARIYLGGKAVEKLLNTIDEINAPQDFEGMRLVWDGTDEYPETVLDIDNVFEDWWKIYRISASDIAFECDPSEIGEEPTEVIYIEIE